MNKKQGFTLLELVLVLIIVGIITLFSPFGLMEAINSYLASKQYSEYNLKISVALTRISRELKELHSVSKYTSQSITYKRDNQDYTLNLVGDELKINGYTLLDKVSAFKLQLEKVDGNSWQLSDSIEELSNILISLTVNTSPPISINFGLNPWFNDTYNGPRKK